MTDERPEIGPHSLARKLLGEIYREFDVSTFTPNHKAELAEACASLAVSEALTDVNLRLQSILDEFAELRKAIEQQLAMVRQQLRERRTIT